MSRFFDILFVIMLFPLFIVLIMLSSILIAVCEGRPIFFSSERLGKNQQTFKIIKLRTMSASAPLIPSSAGNASAYVTKLGRFLRLMSLDELPQIFNILAGSMTFIGPRPCLPSEHKLIELRNQNGIFSMKPGLTGLAQVRGRDRISLKNKVRYELFYSKKKSIIFDLKILFMTIGAILNFSDISH